MFVKCFLCGQFGHVRADCLENRRDVSNDRDDETSESNLSNDIGRDEDGSDVSRSSDEDMDRVESTSCKDPGGIRDEVMNGIYNDASQHHQQNKDLSKQSRTTKGKQKWTFPYLTRASRFLRTPLTNVSVKWEAHLKKRQKRPIRGKRRRGKNIINIKEQWRK